MNEPAWRGLDKGARNSTMPEAPNIPSRKTSDLTPPPPRPTEPLTLQLLNSITFLVLKISTEVFNIPYRICISPYLFFFGTQKRKNSGALLKMGSHFSEGGACPFFCVVKWPSLRPRISLSEILRRFDDVI